MEIISPIFIYRLRVRLLEQKEIEDMVVWEQKILIGAIPLVQEPGDGQIGNLLLRKGSAREHDKGASNSV